MSDAGKSGKKFNMIIAVTIAILMWFYVLNVESPVGNTTISNVPIEVIGADVLDSNDLVVTQLDRDNMDLTATGKRKNFLQLFAEDIVVQIDVSHLTQPGEYELTGRVSPTNFFSEYNITMTEKQGFITFVTLQNKTSKIVPLEGDFVGTTPDGYEVSEVSCFLEEVEVTGPEEFVSQITKAVVVFDDENVKNSVTRQLTIMYVNDAGEIISSELVNSSTNKVYATLLITESYTLPLTIDFIEGGGATIDNVYWSIEPKEVVLSGDNMLLKSMKEISLGEIDLATILDEERLIIQIPLPENVVNHTASTHAVVEISVDGLETKKVAVRSVIFENVPEGYSAFLTSGYVEIWVRGEKRAVEDITSTNIELVVDLSGIDVNTPQHETLAVPHMLQEKEADVILLDYSVLVNIQKK